MTQSFKWLVTKIVILCLTETSKINFIAFNYLKHVDIHYTGYLVSAPTIDYLDILTDSIDDYIPGGGEGTLNGYVLLNRLCFCLF